MLKAIEGMMKAADARSCLGIAEGFRYAHDSIYRSLEIELERYFVCCLELERQLGGLCRGNFYLCTNAAKPTKEKKLTAYKLWPNIKELFRGWESFRCQLGNQLPYYMDAICTKIDFGSNFIP